MFKTKGKIFILMTLIGVITILQGQACSPAFSTKFVDDSSTVQLSSQKKCAPPEGISGSPTTIEEAVSLINALPKPVTVACFLESLDRPLFVSLTNNEQSAQPAAGERNPRIFIIIDKLFISVVPEGRGQDFIEFSYRSAPDMTIKAELEFPVVQTVSASQPYENVLFGAGTSCSVCHRQERRAVSIDFTKAYESKALAPSPETIVPLNSFKRETLACNNDTASERCEIIKSLFGFGEVLSRDFPSDIPAAF